MIAGSRKRTPKSRGVALFDDYTVVDRHGQSSSTVSLASCMQAAMQDYTCPVTYDDPKRESITCFFQVQEDDHDGIHKISKSKLRHSHLLIS